MIGSDRIPYYKREAEYVYNQVKEKELTCWSELFEDCGYEEFPGRSFWEAVLNQYRGHFSGSDVFEYGCGTGPLSCFLSEYVRSIHATDVSPIAIKMAEGLCENKNVKFKTMDFAVPHTSEKFYDIVVDNYVTQQVVDKNSRKNIFNNVFEFLGEKGKYVLTTIVSKRGSCMSKKKMSENVESYRLHRSVDEILIEIEKHGLKVERLVTNENRCCIVSRKKTHKMKEMPNLLYKYRPFRTEKQKSFVKDIVVENKVFFASVQEFLDPFEFSILEEK